MAGTRNASPCSEAPEVLAPGSLTRRDAETAFAESLAWLAEATHAATAPVSLERAWQRVQARVAGEAPAGVAAGVSRLAHRAGFGWAPVFRQRLRMRWVALVLVTAAGALGLLAWSHLASRNRSPAALREVRVNPLLWETEAVAEAPAADAIDELTGILKP